MSQVLAAIFELVIGVLIVLFRKRIADFLIEIYRRRSIPVGTSSPALTTFRDALSDLLLSFWPVLLRIGVILVGIGFIIFGLLELM